MDKIGIGNLIKQRRKLLGITQKDLAEIASIGLRFLKDIETGKGNPSVETLEKILTPLGLQFEIRIKS